MKKQYIVAIAVLLGLGIGGYAVASVATSQLSACVAKDGDTRLIVLGFTKKQTCEKGEQLISWNTAGQQGPQGIAGPQGPKGDTGATGPQGQIGLTGSQGIQGPSGKDGVDGQDGIQGPKGDKGETGASGNSLRLHDANNQDLGILLNMSTNNLNYVFEYDTYLPNDDVSLSFKEVRGQVTRIGLTEDVYFTQANCQGQAYLLGKAIPKRQTTQTMFDGSIYRGNNTDGIVIDLSSRKHPTQTCENFQPQNWGGTKSYEVEPLTTITEPIALPLSISSN